MKKGPGIRRCKLRSRKGRTKFVQLKMTKRISNRKIEKSFKELNNQDIDENFLVCTQQTA